MAYSDEARHLSESEIVRHLDGEGDQAEDDRRQRHLRTCEACAERLRTAERESAAVTAWLERTDTQYRPGTVPEARRRVPAGQAWLKAAAVVLLVTAPLAALPPVRQWVAEQVGLGSDPVERQEPEPAQTLRLALRFTPAAGTFTVRLDKAVPGAQLTVERSEGAEAILEGVEGVGREGSGPVITEDQLRLPSSPLAAPVRYRLRLPQTVRAVQLVVDGRVTPIPGASIDQGATLSLGDR